MNLSKLMDVSRSEKHKNVESILGFLKSGDKLKSCAIFTAENPDSTALPKKENRTRTRSLTTDLKNGHYPFIPVKGYFKENFEHSFAVFNIGVNRVKNLAGYYQQESFIYIIPTDKGIEAQYWQLTHPGEKYQENLNPYFLKNTVTEWHESTEDDDGFTRIMHKLDFTFDPKLFDSVLNTLPIPENWFMILDGVGMGAYAAQTRYLKQFKEFVNGHKETF